MKNLVINSENVQKNWTYKSEGWKLTGDSQHNGSDGKVRSINCQVFKVVSEEEETYAGNVTGWMNGEQMKLNVNDISAADISTVSLMVDDLIAELNGAED